MTFQWEKPARIFILFMMLAIAMMLTACGNGTSNAKEESTKASNETSESNKDWPEKISLGVLPGEEDSELSRGYDILVDDMSKALGIEVELYQGEDYNAVIEAMRSKKLDLASFGPFSYTIAAERSGAIPIATRATNEEEATYKSWIVVPDESDVQSLEELKGKSLLFADPASTSGHMFPRSMLINELGLTNEEIESYFSSVSFSGSHDNSILAIAEGNVDAAGVCSSCVENAIKGGLVKKSDFRIIKESEPIPSSPLAYRAELPESLVEEIKQFIFSYDNESYFEKVGEKGERFYPVDDSYYDVIRETAEALNMNPEDLLSK